MVTCRDCCRCPPNNALPLAHSPFTFLITNCLDEANWDLIVWQPRLLVSLQAIFLRFHAVCSSNRFSTKLYAPAVDTTAHFSLLCSHHHHSLWWVSHLIASERIFSLLRSFRSFFFLLAPLLSAWSDAIWAEAAFWSVVHAGKQLRHCYQNEDINSGGCNGVHNALRNDNSTPNRPIVTLI